MEPKIMVCQVYYYNFNHRTQQPEPPHGLSPLHPADERLLEEVGESLGRRHALVHVLQFSAIHKSLRVTPAMAHELTDHVWDIAELIA